MPRQDYIKLIELILNKREECPEDIVKLAEISNRLNSVPTTSNEYHKIYSTYFTRERENERARIRYAKIKLEREKLKLEKIEEERRKKKEERTVKI